MQFAKSHFSFGYGTASVPALVDCAADLGLHSLALVDEENLCGQVAFHHLARTRGLMPITGVELGRRVVLLARDRSGWTSLCRILSARRARFDPDLDALLRRHAAGLEVLPFDPAREVTTLGPGDEGLHRLLSSRSCREPRPRVLARDGAPAPLGFTLDLTCCEHVLPNAAAPLEPLKASAAALGRGYPQRLARELEVFALLRLEPYLGLVAEVCEFARERGIELAVRGPAAGSLAMHLLGASPVDPVAHGLSFERFLHEGSAALPGLELDVDAERRAELVDFVHRRFGRDRTAMVCSFVTFREASAAEVAHEPELQRRLIGTPRHLAVHPGGIVVADRPLDELVPLERTSRGVIVTQLDPGSVSRAGLVRLDLLGNRCLTQLHRAIALHHLPPRAQIPEDDRVTLAALGRADTIGCFQVETPAVRSVLARLPIRRLDDCTAALAAGRGEGETADAASYARLAFETVYLMQHDPAALGCALLDSYAGHYPLRTIAWELQRKGVRLLPPCVNRSHELCVLEEGAVRLGLGRIRRVTVRTRRVLLQGRPFHRVSELVGRVSLRELEALVLSGACDCLDPLDREAFPLAQSRALGRAGSDVALEQLAGWPELARVYLELNHLELSVSGHPMALLRPESDAAGCVRIGQLLAERPREARVAATLAASRPVETASGATAQLLTLEDEDGLLEALMLPHVRQALAPQLSTPGPYLVVGDVTDDRGEVRLDVRWLAPFYPRRPGAHPSHLH